MDKDSDVVHKVNDSAASLSDFWVQRGGIQNKQQKRMGAPEESPFEVRPRLYVSGPHLGWFPYYS